MDAHKLLQEAIRNDYGFVLLSRDEMVFYRRHPPMLSRHEFFAGALLGSVIAREIVEHGLGYNLPVQWKDD
jgi:hypothetical protein